MQQIDTANPRLLTSGRLLAGNIIWNLVGTLAPGLLAIFCLPILKHVLGTDRLGVISLAFVVVGYFGLFDFGLGRALTKMVAERVGQRGQKEIPGLIWTSLLLMSLFGMTGAVLGVALSPWLIYHILKIPNPLRHETLLAFYWLSSSIPLVVLTAGLRGVLEALQQFRIATAIRVPVGIFTYLGPVLVLPFSHSVGTIVAALVCARCIACVAHFYACFKVVPSLKHLCLSDMSSIASLLHFGSWMTVSNAIAPLLIWFDRFVIAAIISISAAAYYAIPSELVIRLTVIPYALLGVLFPAFSTANAHIPERVDLLWQATLRYIFIAQFPIVLLLIAFAPEGLRIWLGPDFAQHSTFVTRWLLAAILINSVATVPYAYLQSIGRPDITAKLQLLELFLYAVILYSLTKKFGIDGAAISWFLRMAFEAACLFYICGRFLPDSRATVARLISILLSALAMFGVVAAVQEIEMRIALVLAIGLSGSLIIWFWMFSARERDFLTAAILKKAFLK